MANYDALKAAMAAVIKPNGQGRITGAKHQAVLRDVINTLGALYQFGGVAHPSDTFDKADIRAAYLASEAGTYEAFGGLELDGSAVMVLLYDGEWHAVDTGITTATRRGIVSQDVTWDNAAKAYVTSNAVVGDIPQAFIDLVTSNAPEGDPGRVAFNAVTGYFELNGLTDIAYDEMLAIYNGANVGNEVEWLGGINPVTQEYTDNGAIVAGTTGRTNMCHTSADQSAVTLNAFAMGTYLAAVRVANGQTVKARGNLSSAFSRGAIISRLKAVYPVIDLSYVTAIESSPATTPFYGCVLLEHVEMANLDTDISLANCRNLSAHSVAYMIANAGAQPLTITLHADAKERALADAEVQAALVQKPNVSLAEA